MNTKGATNVVASVLARLRNTSKSNGVPFQQVLQQYALTLATQRVQLKLWLQFGLINDQ